MVLSIIKSRSVICFDGCENMYKQSVRDLSMVIGLIICNVMND